jgi:hypothetical protein
MSRKLYCGELVQQPSLLPPLFNAGTQEYGTD